MATFIQKITCPFCFCAFSPPELRFRCMHPDCPGRSPDPEYATARGYGVTIMGRVLVPAKRRLGTRFPHEVGCDLCKQISHTPLCPNCHFELSHDIGQIDQRIIAIIGARATGKSHYIASLVNRLQRETGQSFAFSVRMLGDNTQERWERDFYTPLFIDKRVLQPTQPAAIDSRVKAPLIFRIAFAGAGYKRVLNISFFDSAGEDMTSLTTMSVQNRYICHADGIIFLLDPLQIPIVRHRLTTFNQLNTANLPIADSKASPENIVGRLRDLFERENKLRATQKVKIPLAFTLSKIDTLRPLLEPGSPLLLPGDHRGGYLDLDDVQSVSTEIANYMADWINPSFCNIINTGFASYNYFGVSSLGEQPDNDHLSRVSPLRVEDPFLWLLYKLDLIKGKKRR